MTTTDLEPSTAPLLGEPLPIELMNTVWADRHGVHDALTTSTEVRAWLAAVGPRLPVAEPDLRRWLQRPRAAALGDTVSDLRRLRDALRRLAATATDDPREAAASAVAPDEAVEVVNLVAAASPTWRRLVRSDGAALAAEVGFSGAIGPAVVSLLAEEAVTLFAGDRLPLLAACLAPGCVLYFARDHGRREWCSVACGNRARAARHYRRTRAAET